MKDLVDKERTITENPQSILLGHLIVTLKDHFIPHLEIAHIVNQIDHLINHQVKDSLTGNPVTKIVNVCHHLPITAVPDLLKIDRLTENQTTHLLLLIRNLLSISIILQSQSKIMANLVTLPANLVIKVVTTPQLPQEEVEVVAEKVDPVVSLFQDSPIKIRALMKSRLTPDQEDLKTCLQEKRPFKR